jgi:hypothetical protein
MKQHAVSFAYPLRVSNNLATLLYLGNLVSAPHCRATEPEYVSHVCPPVLLYLTRCPSSCNAPGCIDTPLFLMPGASFPLETVVLHQQLRWWCIRKSRMLHYQPATMPSLMVSVARCFCVDWGKLTPLRSNTSIGLIHQNQSPVAYPCKEFMLEPLAPAVCVAGRF